MNDFKRVKDIHEKILDNMWTGVWAVDSQERLIFFNKGMEILSGFSKEDVIGTNLMEYIGDQGMGDQGHFRELFFRVRNSLRPAPYSSLPMVTKNGSLVYQNGVLIPLIDENGIYDGMVGTIENISKKKLAERAIKDVLDTEKELDIIYNSSPVVAFLWKGDEGWPVEYVSENISQFGYMPKDFTSGSVNYVDIIHPDDLEKVRSDVESHFEKGNTYFSKEYRILTKKGDVRWVTERSLIAGIHNGKITYFQGIIIDITEQKRVEEELKKYAQELERSNDLKDLFTDIMRHDLLNPAGIIKGFTTLLLEIEDEEDKLNIIKKIDHNTDKLMDMIESAAKFAKLESVEELDFEEKDLVFVLRKVLEDFRPQIEDKQMQVEFGAHDTCPSSANVVIEDVFANLLSNAIKYSPAGSRIIVDILDEGNFWKVEVIDFGEGIPDESKPKIFNRFKRADKKGVKGTGLGLAIVKRIIDLHGGSVGVMDNPEGKGSIFWVTLRKV